MSAFSYLYKTKRWQRIRAAHIASEPLCRRCSERGDVTPAKIVDHVRPHRGDLDLFYSMDNLQSLCARHHSRDKQQEEWAADNVQPVRVDGYKLDGSW